MEKYELVKFKNGSLELDVEVSPNEDTVWLTQIQMASLFNVTKNNISYHVNNILKEQELDSSVTKESWVPGPDSKIYKTKLYNLDMIISVGYRVKSKNGIIFRKWANAVLKEYLLKGYAVSRDRVLVTDENYINLINDVNSLREDVKEIKKALSYKCPNSFVCYEGNIYDSFVFINTLIRSAKKRIVIIDGYADNTVLDFFTGSNNKVKKTILCHKIDRIDKILIEKFIKQYGEITFKEDKSYHDRFLIIDDDIYILGASLNSLGNKTSTITKTDEYAVEDIYKEDK